MLQSLKPTYDKGSEGTICEHAGGVSQLKICASWMYDFRGHENLKLKPRADINPR